MKRQIIIFDSELKYEYEEFIELLYQRLKNNVSCYCIGRNYKTNNTIIELPTYNLRIIVKLSTN